MNPEKTVTVVCEPDIKHFEEGRDYKYTTIEAFAFKNEFTLTELGPDSIGKNIIVLEEEDRDTTLTFLLTGYSNQAIYTLVYKFPSYKN